MPLQDQQGQVKWHPKGGATGTRPSTCSIAEKEAERVISIEDDASLRTPSFAPTPRVSARRVPVAIPSVLVVAQSVEHQATLGDDLSLPEDVAYQGPRTPDE